MKVPVAVHSHGVANSAENSDGKCVSGRLTGKELLLARREFDAVRRRHPGHAPTHVGYAVLVEQGPSLVVAVPTGRAVGQCFGEEGEAPGGRREDFDPRGGLVGFVDVLGNAEAALVAAGNATETTDAGAGIAQVPCAGYETRCYAVVVQRVVLARNGGCVRRAGAVVGVQPAGG